ncbi:MAG: methyltransferase domain-containing protein [Chloroflexota bacterium]
MNRALPPHNYIVQKEFSTQAAQWAGPVPNNLHQLMASLNFQRDEQVLDVAAGSCRVSRAISPLVRQVSAVELTAAMLNTGREMAEQEGLSNICFRQGSAEYLPFRSAQFDTTITRYSFHHFVDPNVVLTEMVRVTKSGGRIIVIDVLAPDNANLALRHNRYQRLRDPSHTQSLSRKQLVACFQVQALKIIDDRFDDRTNDLEGWMNLPSFNEATKAHIRQAVHAELTDGAVTGLQPFLEEGVIKFKEPIGLLVGQKS